MGSPPAVEAYERRDLGRQPEPKASPNRKVFGLALSRHLLSRDRWREPDAEDEAGEQVTPHSN